MKATVHLVFCRFHPSTTWVPISKDGSEVVCAHCLKAAIEAYNASGNMTKPISSHEPRKPVPLQDLAHLKWSDWTIKDLPKGVTTHLVEKCLKEGSPSLRGYDNKLYMIRYHYDKTVTVELYK